MRATRLARVSGAVAAAGLLVAAGWLARGWWSRGEAQGPERRVRVAGYRFISPLLDVELPEGFDVRHEPIPFRRRVAEYVEARVAAGAVRDLAVYYRDLLDGPWFGVNAEARFDPASLMKVPVMIAWLRRAERDPAVLHRRLTFDEGAYPGPAQATPPPRTLQPGASYEVEALLGRMVSGSDNRAAWLLFRELGEEELGEVLDRMDVVNEPGPDGNHVTAHGYSGFFRVLFNASFLGREMSERALELLSHRDFPQGMAAGVAPGVVVASKFGEAVGPGGVELHEFGIVYHPAGPYILGVMTRGDDLGRQAGIIREVSALVFEAHAAGAEPAPR